MFTFMRLHTSVLASVVSYTAAGHMNIILVLIKLEKMFAMLHVVGKYLYYSIVYLVIQPSLHMFVAATEYLQSLRPK